MNVTKMTFSDNEFDTVVCMEVLEHIDRDQFVNALKQLRRVTAKYLFMTVPFREPLPLQSYHKLRFDFNDLNMYFPDGKYYLLIRRKGIPWMVIVEYLERC
jgi:2-polyprenyl-3-methyl-5-hydroxy-6-metoxy-1,4-benzoquinol methylase